MKIILNPPYSGNLHLKILREAMQHSDDIVNLSPIKWRNPLSYFEDNSASKIVSEYGDIFQSLKSLDIIDSKTAHDLFGTCNSNSLGIYSLNLKEHNHSAFEYMTDEDMLVKNILKKADVCYNHATSKARSSHFVRVPAIYGNEDPSWLIRVCSSDFTRYYNIDKGLKHCAPYMNFKTKEECINFHKSLSLNLIKYVHFKCRFGANTQMKALIYLGDYTHPWTDADLYAYFGLTPDEIDIIEKEMAKNKMSSPKAAHKKQKRME